MREWLKEYAAWLENSTIGKAERATLNNHGTHYDEQLATILIYLGEIEKVKQILESVKSNRIAAQIEPDGKQPRELERTKAFSYSTMNLSGMIALAQLGQVYGIDLWNYETNDGRSIKKAINFLIPFANNPEKWEYDQIASMEDSVHKFKLMVGAAAYRFNDPFLKEFAQKDLTKADGLFLLTNPLYAE
jgi:hypothetical protein